MIIQQQKKQNYFNQSQTLRMMTYSVMSSLSEYLYGLVEALGLVIERDVANWIANQGGWVSVGFYLSLHFLCIYMDIFSLILLDWLQNKKLQFCWTEKINWTCYKSKVVQQGGWVSVVIYLSFPFKCSIIILFLLFCWTEKSVWTCYKAKRCKKRNF